MEIQATSLNGHLRGVHIITRRIFLRRYIADTTRQPLFETHGCWLVEHNLVFKYSHTSACKV